MKYKIYILVKPSHLQTTELDGYNIKTIERVVLEVPDYYTNLDDTFISMQEANQAIIDNKEKVKYMELCILPVVSVDYNYDLDVE